MPAFLVVTADTAAVAQNRIWILDCAVETEAEGDGKTVLVDRVDSGATHVWVEAQTF